MKKLKHILSYPIQRIFKYDIVLRITVRSIFILFSLFSFAWVTEYFFNSFFEKVEPLIYVLKDTLHMIIALLPLGYFMSKYKFCVTTLLSFYMVIFLRVFWMINTYLIEVPMYKEFNIAFILLAWSIIIYDRIQSNKK